MNNSTILGILGVFVATIVVLVIVYLLTRAFGTSINAAIDMVGIRKDRSQKATVVDQSLLINRYLGTPALPPELKDYAMRLYLSTYDRSNSGAGPVMLVSPGYSIPGVTGNASAGSVFCAQCGQPNDASSAFCAFCGTAIPKQAAASGEGGPSVTLARSNGQELVATSFPATIGKAPEANLTITDNPAISRIHARLLCDGSSFAVEDLGSSNGTRVNGYTIASNTPTVISDGDELRLANERLRISSAE